MAAHQGSKRTVYAALAGNLAIAATKLVAAAVTGSSAMLSEGVHSLVDTGNEVLLLHGLHRSTLPPDDTYPLGHGRELYFWSFIVAVLVFALGAGVSVYEGVSHILRPEPMENVVVNYVVLGLSAIFEGISWTVAMRQFRAAKGDLGFLAAARRSKDPTTFTVLFEDSAALLGIALAAIGIFAAQRLGIPELDGAASIAIGLVLAFTAAFLARESKGLLIGERASRDLQRAIAAAAAEDPAITAVESVLTVHLAPDQVVVALTADFEDEVSAAEIERCIARLELRLEAEHEEISALFIRPRPARRREALASRADRPRQGAA
jgi:cation diffusion facilitator family transporter